MSKKDLQRIPPAPYHSKEETGVRGWRTPCHEQQVGPSTRPLRATRDATWGTAEANKGCSGMLSAPNQSLGVHTSPLPPPESPGARASTHLRGPAEQEPAWVEAIHAALGTVAIVHVAGPGHRPLAVVE